MVVGNRLPQQRLFEKAERRQTEHLRLKKETDYLAQVWSQLLVGTVPIGAERANVTFELAEHLQLLDRGVKISYVLVKIKQLTQVLVENSFLS